MSRVADVPPVAQMATVRESFLKQTRQLKETQGYQPVRTGVYYRVPAPINKEYIGKRMFDLIVGSVAALIFFVLYPFIALGIKFSSKGPVIFKQYRTGINGDKFVCYKFRTMHVVRRTPMDGSPDITQKGDSRVFTFGCWLRRSNLDELPQILNVLKGEMSLIGPRPYPVEECKYWNNTFDDFYFRYMVKPGVTGYAQVNGYRGGTLDVTHMRARLDKDLIYVEKQSFWMDVRIIVKTIVQMLTFKTNAH